ncbi:MAG: hypothetical protein M1834_001339 [Cirrosporium novae-zelandiae]|nr:MAG: hypothetical protein M1834_001339 [Cirrosporium novae-zelandiae]
MASTDETKVLAERPAPAATPAAPSKGALKKAAKEKEKAEKAAKRKAEEEAARAKAEANDTAKGLYGTLPSTTSPESTPKIVWLDDLSEASIDNEITIQARIHNSRIQSAKLAFFNLRDHVKIIQAVLAESDGSPISRLMIKWAGALSAESTVRVTALVQKPREPVASASPSLQNLELHIQKIYLVADSEPMLPMQIKDASRAAAEGNDAQEGQTDASGAPVVTLNTLLNNRTLSLRAPVNLAIMEISSGVVQLFSEYMYKNRFRQVQSPKLIGTASEGGSGVFEVKYFNTKAFLAQSPQLYKQMYISGGLKRVFEVGPVFRAENSNTHRHMTEFTGLDFEMEFYDHYHEVLGFAEELIVHILQGLKERYKDEIFLVQQLYPEAGNFLIPDHGKALRLKYFEGIELLKEAGVDVSEQLAMTTDLSTAQEKQLGKIIHEKYHTDFYVLDKFPLQNIRPFYTMPDPEDPKLSNSYDFFMRGEEIMSGAQRIHDPKLLIERMKAQDPPLDPNDPGFKDYVNAFRYGCSPHAGGGLGLNRIVQFFLGLPNIRLATGFPRDPTRLAP